MGDFLKLLGINNGTVTVGGSVYSGRSIVIRNGTVTVDGVKQTNYAEEGGEHKYEVFVKADSVDSIETVGNVTVEGNSYQINTAGNVTVQGNNGGSINTAGNVTVQGSCGGSINTMGKVSVGSRR